MRETLRRYTELPYLIDYLRTQELTLLSPASWDDRNDTHYLGKYAHKVGLGAIRALCLTHASETYHHWRLYSQGSGGVCIEFDKDSLLKHVKRLRYLKAEPVRYRTLRQLREEPPKRAELPFLKRSTFEAEREFRLVILRKASPDEPIRVAVPLDAVNRVMLSPWLPSEVADQVKALLKSVKGAETLKVYRSSLVENRDWKRLAET